MCVGTMTTSKIRWFWFIASVTFVCVCVCVCVCERARISFSNSDIQPLTWLFWPLSASLNIVITDCSFTPLTHSLKILYYWLQVWPSRHSVFYHHLIVSQVIWSLVPCHLKHQKLIILLNFYRCCVSGHHHNLCWEWLRICCAKCCG